MPARGARAGVLLGTVGAGYVLADVDAVLLLGVGGSEGLLPGLPDDEDPLLPSADERPSVKSRRTTSLGLTAWTFLLGVTAAAADSSEEDDTTLDMVLDDDLEGLELVLDLVEVLDPPLNFLFFISGSSVGAGITYETSIIVISDHRFKLLTFNLSFSFLFFSSISSALSRPFCLASLSFLSASSELSFGRLDSMITNVLKISGSG